LSRYHVHSDRVVSIFQSITFTAVRDENKKCVRLYYYVYFKITESVCLKEFEDFDFDIRLRTNLRLVVYVVRFNIRVN
jgi:hypothetical protein